MATKAGRKAEQVGDSAPLEVLARGGLIAYGVVHLLIGWLALQIAWGAAGNSADTSGALTTLADPSFGKILLWLGAVGLLALALWQSRNFGYRAGLFPWVIGIPTFVLCFLQLARDLRGAHKKKDAHPGDDAEVEIAPAVVRKRTLDVIGWTAGFFVAIWLLGFSIAVPLMILLYLKVAGKESWLMTAQVTFFSWLFYWGLFEKLLNVPFPEGLLIGLFKGPQ